MLQVYDRQKVHTDPPATPFALQVMQHDERIPAISGKRSTTSISACTARRWRAPPISLPSACRSVSAWCPGVTDKNYITNSYHVHVTNRSTLFASWASRRSSASLPGGAISYMEVPNMQNNLEEAVIKVMKFIYDNIIYAELNTKSDYCQECGDDGEIQIIEGGRQAGLGMPPLQKPRSEQAQCGAAYLRVYRNAVLEPGTACCI